MVSTLDMIEVDRAAVDMFESTLRDELRLLAKRESYSDPSALIELAREFVALGEIEDALDCFGRALEKDPLRWEAYVGRAEVVQGLYIMRDEGGSEAGLGAWVCSDLESALRCVDSENRSLVYRLLITANLVAGKYDEVKDLAARALVDGICDVDSDRCDLIYSLAFAELFLGEEDEAVRLFRSLPRGYEAGLFGSAVCQMRSMNVDAMQSLRFGLSRCYLQAFDFLSTCGVTSYLDVARSLCVAAS